ncbi:MAG: nuclear transport factor 2 family protein [Cyclobacteriaceae bacterium]|nr:MAG: nuclear transport factor 2 family protein [Cyclobacteriaceae bacterium]
MRFYLLLIPYVILNSCVQTKQYEVSDIEVFLGDYYRIMSDRDWIKYKTFFIDNASLTTIWQTESDSVPGIFSVSIDEFIDQTPQGPDSQPIFEERMISHEITVKGNLAQAWVKYEAAFGTDENLMRWKGYDQFSLIRFKVEWRIVSIVYESLEK